MSREIKFRGKRLDNNEWIYGSLVADEISDKNYIVISVDESEKTGEEGCLRVISCEVDKETVGQYTGLKDDKGIKIYESDIVKIIIEKTVKENGYLDREVPVEINYVTIFDSIELGFKFTNGQKEYGNNFEYLCCCEDLLQITGNKHDNPEMLEGDI